MVSEDKSLHFLEQILEDDIQNGFPQNKLRFRFPPEPNGYLHIGHAKSICLNFGLGQKYNAPVNLRFDDTNPAKEEQEYVDAIKHDLHWLGFAWDKECYASDYFQQLYDWAVLLIQKGKAYVDSQSSEDIALQKGSPTKIGVESPFRNRSIEENLHLFEGMKNGDFPEGSHVLRAKIDMTHTNMLMRDPFMYRILHRHHHRTGNNWKIYPMYDYAHGESDYLEQISHSICTLEFVMHRELYNWFLDQLKESSKVVPKQYEFARLNLNYTVMSKRKLLQLVQDKIVSGWDDPRMPTISGLRRRGYTAASIRNFCETIGVAKRENVIDFSLLEFCLREDLNKKAPRVMAVLDPVKVVITNYEDNKIEFLDAENNPEDLDAGFRKVPFAKELYIEREDFLEAAPPKFFRLSLGSEVRLKNAYIIKGEAVVKDATGKIIEIHVTYDIESLSGSGSEAANRKVAGTLHWVSVQHAVAAEVRLYDRLFSDEAPDTHKEKVFLDFINPNSLQIITAFVEPSLTNASVLSHYQFQRLGYFTVDSDSSEEKLVFNKTVALKDAWEEKSKKEENSIHASLKEINKYFKVTTREERIVIRKAIGETLAGISNYSLLQNSFKKNINNNKASLLFAQFIVKYSILKFSDFDKDELAKLFYMSFRSESTFVRFRAFLNLLNLNFDIAFILQFKDEILKLNSNPSKSTTERETEYLEKLIHKFYL